jgi:hypothetical protein
MTAARRLAAILAADVAVPTTDPLAGTRRDQAKKKREIGSYSDSCCGGGDATVAAVRRVKWPGLSRQSTFLTR